MLTASLDRGLDDYWNTRTDADRATQLQEDLRQHWVTNQAIGMLMAAFRLTTDDAAAMLQEQATTNGVTPHQAAQQLINQQLHQPLLPAPTPQT